MEAIAYREALEILRAAADRRLATSTEVVTSSALGRVSAASVASPVEVPAFANSAMDGYAVRARETSAASPEHPTLLPIRGLVTAGARSRGALDEDASLGTQVAVEITTGAPLPSGFDAVVRLEDARLIHGAEGQAIVSLAHPAQPGDDVRLAGTDFRVGDAVLCPGEVLGPSQLMALASLGLARVAVRRTPRVALLGTGSELAPIDQPELCPGAIRDATGPLILSSLRDLGVEVEPLGAVRDDVDVIHRRIDEARRSGVDLVLSTGGVSVGRLDLVPACLQRLGASVRFHRAHIRPGKPILFAELPSSDGPGPVFFGLPGNPIATMVGLRFFVIPYLRQLLGLPPERPLRACLAEPRSKPAHLRAFIEGRARQADAGIEVLPLPNQGSYRISPLLQASCWAVLSEGVETIPQGAEVEVYPLHHRLDGGMFT